VAGEAVRRGLAVIADRAASSTARTECIAALAGLTTFGLTFVPRVTNGDARRGAEQGRLLARDRHRTLERAGARRV
jgi:hypothetical protein